MDTVCVCVCVCAHVLLYKYMEMCIQCAVYRLLVNTLCVYSTVREGEFVQKCKKWEMWIEIWKGGRENM